MLGSHRRGKRVVPGGALGRAPRPVAKALTTRRLLSRGVGVRGALAVALSGLLLAPGEALALCPPQQSPEYDRQIAITVVNPGPAREAIVLATIDTTMPVARGEMQADGADVRIVTSSCVEVPFWIEGGLGTSQTKIWMRVPSLASGRNQIDLFYGHGSASSVSSVDAVFGAGLVSLFTFTENGGGTVFDRAGTNHLAMSATWADGPMPGVGAATGFETGRLLRAGGGPALGSGSFTVLTLVNPTDTGGVRGIFGNYATDTDPGWAITIQGTMPGRFMFITNAGNDGCPNGEGNGNIPIGTWSLVGGRRQAGVTNSLLFNGQPIFEACAGDTRNVDGPGPFEIGRSYGGTTPFAGKISMSFVWSRALSDGELLAFDRALRADPPPSVPLAGAPPGPPVIGTATPHGNTSVMITFSPPASSGDGRITGYEAICAPFGEGRSTGSPVTVSGLAPGMEHKCAVRAVNIYGVGPWSKDTNTFIPGNAPSIGSPSLARFVVGQDGTFTIEATGAPEPTVTVKGTLPPGLVSNGGVISGLPALGSVGVYPLEVTAENGIMPIATQALTLEVVKATQRIDFLPVPPQTLGPDAIELTVSATSGLPVALESLSPSVCTVTGTAVKMLGAGVCAILASQAGDANFEPAPTVTMSFQIAPVVTTPEDAGPPPPDAEASVPVADGGEDAATPSTPSTPPPSVQTPPSSLTPTNPSSPLEEGAVEGGGFLCTASGAPAPAGGFALAIAGLVAGAARRRRRAAGAEAE